MSNSSHGNNIMKGWIDDAMDVEDIIRNDGIENNHIHSLPIDCYSQIFNFLGSESLLLYGLCSRFSLKLVKTLNHYFLPRQSVKCYLNRRELFEIALDRLGLSKLILESSQTTTNMYKSVNVIVKLLQSKNSIPALEVLLERNHFDLKRRYPLMSRYNYFRMEYPTTIAVSSQNIQVLKFLSEKKKCVIDDNACVYASENGDIECLKYLCMNGCDLNNSEACRVASERGFLSCLEFLFENGCRCNDTACRDAAKYGHLDCLQFLRSNGISWTTAALDAAVENGQMEVVKYLYGEGLLWTHRTTKLAAKNGHLDVLMYATENGADLDKSVLDTAAMEGHVRCLQFVHESGFPPDDETSQHVVRSGNLECLTYLARVRCPWNGSELCKIATFKGHLAILKFLHEQDCELTDQMFLTAVENGNLDCVEFLLQHDAANYDERALAYASTGGHLEILQYLMKYGFQAVTDAPCNSAAAAGELECLEHLIGRTGAPWTEGTFLYASTNETVDCLRFLHENCGSHWNEQAVHAAALSGRVNCMKYLLENGCNYDEDSCLSALRMGKSNSHRECIAYLYRRKMNGESNSDVSMNSPTSVTNSHSNVFAR